MFKFVSYTSNLNSSKTLWSMPLISGIFLIGFGFLILFMPNLLEIIVASMLIFMGGGLVLTGLALKSSSKLFNSYKDPFHSSTKSSIVVDSIDVE